MTVRPSGSFRAQEHVPCRARPSHWICSPPQRIPTHRNGEDGRKTWQKNRDRRMQRKTCTLIQRLEPQFRPYRRGRQRSALRSSGACFPQSTRVLCGEYSSTCRRVRRRTPHNAAEPCRKEKRETRNKKTDKQPIPDFVNVSPKNHRSTMVRCVDAVA